MKSKSGELTWKIMCACGHLPIDQHAIETTAKQPTLQRNEGQMGW